jgi:hypothetical protein
MRSKLTRPTILQFDDFSNCIPNSALLNFFRGCTDGFGAARTLAGNSWNGYSTRNFLRFAVRVGGPITVHRQKGPEISAAFNKDSRSYSILGSYSPCSRLRRYRAYTS